jgi:hypothetical protein
MTKGPFIFNSQGYDKDGFNEAGRNKKGYDREGFNVFGRKNGFNRSGYHAKDGIETCSAGFTPSLHCYTTERRDDPPYPPYLGE